MSYPGPQYPPTRYHGTTGEVSATFRPAADGPDYVSVPVTSTGPTVATDTAYFYLATTISTQGD